MSSCGIGGGLIHLIKCLSCFVSEGLEIGLGAESFRHHRGVLKKAGTRPAFFKKEFALQTFVAEPPVVALVFSEAFFGGFNIFGRRDNHPVA